VANHIGRRQSNRQLTVHRLRNDQAEVMAEPVFEPRAPMLDPIAVAEHRFDPDLAALPDLDGTARHIVRPEIECAAARQGKARMMPMAGEDAVIDAAAFEREAHMRAAIVERQYLPVIVHDENRAMMAVHNQPPLRLQLLNGARAHET